MDTLPLTLTFGQRRRLEDQLRTTPDARVYRRTLAILEIASGELVPSVARRLRVSPRAVYHWLVAYSRAYDGSALADGGRSGRPPLLDQRQRELLRGLLARSPQDLGYPRTVWTVPALRDYLRRHHGLLLSGDTVRRELRHLGFTWKRPRYRLDPDPESRGTKDADPPANQAVAASERGAGAGRDRPAPVPAVAVLLVALGRTPGGSAIRA